MLFALPQDSSRVFFAVLWWNHHEANLHEIMRGSAETRQETIYVITSSLSSRRKSAVNEKKLSRRKTIYLKYFQIEIAAPSIYKSHQMSRVMYYYQRWWDEIYISVTFIHLAFGCRLAACNVCFHNKHVLPFSLCFLVWGALTFRK